MIASHRATRDWRTSSGCSALRGPLWVGSAILIALLAYGCEAPEPVPDSPTAPSPDPAVGRISNQLLLGDGCAGRQAYDPFDDDCYCENLGSFEFCYYPPNFPGGGGVGGGGSTFDPEMTCTPQGSTVRGNRWTCVVTGLDPEDVTGIQWSFEPDPLVFFAQDTVDWLSGASPVLGDEDMGSEWQGPVVHPGTVQAEIGTEEHGDVFVSDRVEPTPRSWPAIESLVRGSFITDVPEVGKAFSLGQNKPVDQAAVTVYSKQGFTPGIVIEGGPNNGYWYVDSPDWEMRHEWDINPYLLPSAPVAWVIQGVPHNRYSLASQLSPPRYPDQLLSGLELHETMNPDPGRIGHQEALRLAIQPGECGNVWEQAERAVAADSLLLVTEVEARVEKKAENAIFWYWDHDRVRENYADTAGYLIDIDTLIVSPPDTVPLWVLHPDELAKEFGVGPPTGCPDPTAQFPS